MGAFPRVVAVEATQRERERAMAAFVDGKRGGSSANGSRVL
jgi:hypothetical protein